MICGLEDRGSDPQVEFGRRWHDLLIGVSSFDSKLLLVPIADQGDGGWILLGGLISAWLSCAFCIDDRVPSMQSESREGA